MSRIKLIGAGLVLTALGFIGFAEQATAATDWVCMNQCYTQFNSCMSSRGTNCQQQFDACRASCGC
jgi:hypothetical protein